MSKEQCDKWDLDKARRAWLEERGRNSNLRFPSDAEQAAFDDGFFAGQGSTPSHALHNVEAPQAAGPEGASSLPVGASSGSYVPAPAAASAPSTTPQKPGETPWTDCAFYFCDKLGKCQHPDDCHGAGAWRVSPAPSTGPLRMEEDVLLKYLREHVPNKYLTVYDALVDRIASTPSATPRSEPFGWYGMMSNGDGTESPRFESGAKPWCLKDMRDAKPLYLRLPLNLGEPINHARLAILWRWGSGTVTLDCDDQGRFRLHVEHAEAADEVYVHTEQEGVLDAAIAATANNRADGTAKACSCGATAGQYHAAGCGYEGVFNG